MTSSDIEYLLKCPDCKQNYNEDVYSSRILPCLHTCCSKCLKSRVSKDTVQCLECGEKSNQRASFPVDTTGKHIANSYRILRENTDFFCDQCHSNGSQQIKAINRCKECNDFLCVQCTDAHLRTKLTRQHHLVAFDELKNSSLKEFHNKQTCDVQEHEGQTMTYYCATQGCEKAICSLCVVREHHQSEHNVKNIDDVYVENKRQVERHLLDVKHMTSAVQDAINRIGSEIQNLGLQETSVSVELDAYFNSCQKALERRRDDLKKKLAQICKNKKKELDGHMNKLTKQKGQLDHACRFSEDHIRYSNAAEFLLVRDCISTRLEILKSQSVDGMPRGTGDVKFVPRNMEKHFIDHSNTLGDVCATLAYIPNTSVQTHDIAVGAEQTPLTITFHDVHNKQLRESGLNIKVEIVNSNNQKTSAVVQDCVETQGCYKVLYSVPRAGKYCAKVMVDGESLSKEGYTFWAKMSDHPAETKEKIEKEEGTKPTNGNPTIGNVVCPEFTLDVLHLHAQNELSNDKKTQTNQKGRHRMPRNMTYAYQKFRGTIATRPLGKSDQHYFEVQVHFFVKRSLRQDLIYEIGLCRKGDVDKHYTIDGHKSAYAICARKCHVCSTICLQAWNNGHRMYHRRLTETSPPGTTHKAVYGFLLDPCHRQWIVVDAKNRNFIVRFKNLDLTKPLWPVFGVYNPDLCNTYLTLRTGKDIKTVLDIPFDTQD